MTKTRPQAATRQQLAAAMAKIHTLQLDNRAIISEAAALFHVINRRLHDLQRDLATLARLQVRQTLPPVRTTRITKKRRR